MICAVVLAAGLSRRMGTQKLLLPFGGTSLIGHVVDRVLQSEVERVNVVVGPHSEAIVAALEGRPVSLVINPCPEAEMLDSVRCGLRALTAEGDAVLLVLGDQPGLSPTLVNQLANAWRASGKLIAVPTHGGKRGHPLLFSTRFCPEILERYDDTGLRGLLRGHPDEVHEFHVSEPGILLDVDRPEDYRLALEALRAEVAAVGHPCADHCPAPNDASSHVAPG
jgi:molybdenum cofactor cytidylyltransferase